MRINRLAVTLTRDGGWRSIDQASIRDTLLYIGAPTEFVNEHADSLLSLNLYPHDYQDPRTVIELLNELIEIGLLPQFLTELLRTTFTPENRSEFRTHLQPLEYDWDEEHNQIRPTTTHPAAEIEVRSNLDELLSAIDSRFPSMLDGAWEAYYSNNPDRYRQCLTSCRELLRQVLDQLGREGTRRQRVERIIGSRSTTEVVDASVQMVESIYAAQSAGTHETTEQHQALFVLVETEHLLYYLIGQSELETEKQKRLKMRRLRNSRTVNYD